MKGIHIAVFTAFAAILALATFAAWLFHMRKSINSTSYITPEALATIGYIKANAAALPLNSVLLTAARTCPEGFSQSVYGTYPGLNKGYMCDTGYTFKCFSAKPSASSCTLNDISDEVSGQINTWGKAELRLCVKRLPPTSFYFLDARQQDRSQCPSNFKLCSPNLCVLGTEQCPINELVFSTENTAGYETERAQVNPFETLDSSKRYYILFKRGSASSKVSNFLYDVTTIIGDGPCLNRDELPHRRNDYSCELEKVNRTGCNSYGKDAQTAFRLDSQKETDTYRQNRITIAQRPFLDFITYNQDSVQLLGIRKIEMPSFVACQNMDLAEFSAYNMNCSDIQDSIYKIVLVLAGGCLLGVLLILLTCFMEIRENIRLVTTFVGYLITFGGIGLAVSYLLNVEKVNGLPAGLNTAINGCEPAGAYGQILKELQAEAGKNNKLVKTMFTFIAAAAGSSFIFGILLIMALFTMKKMWKDQDKTGKSIELTPLQLASPGYPIQALAGSTKKSYLPSESPYPYYHQRDI